MSSDTFAPPTTEKIPNQPLVMGDWFVRVYSSTRNGWLKVTCKHTCRPVAINTEMHASAFATFDPDKFYGGKFS